MSGGSGGRKKTMTNSSFDGIFKANVEGEISGNCSEATTASNLTGPHYGQYCEPIESLPLALISGAVAVVTIVANFLVILAIIRGSSRFQKPMYWLIIHLSSADLLVGLMLLWNYCLASLIGTHNTITSLMVIFCIWVSSEAASTIGFVLLAVDRYIQIFHKTFHRTYITKVTVGLAIFMTWAYAIGMFSVAPIAFGWSCKDSCTCTQGKYMQCLPRTDCSQIVPPFKKSYTLAIAAMLFVTIPIPVGIYSAIFIKVRRKTQVVRHSHRSHDMRLIRTLSVILAVFIVTLCPVAILASIDYVNNEENDRMIDIAFYIFVLAFLNSLANPLLYMWRMTAIRRSVRNIFGSTKNGQRRREFTSYQSDNRSPTCNRERHDTDHLDQLEKQQFISQNNNMPRAAVLCLRQMSKGKYNGSHSSTPLSERAENQNHQNHAPLNMDGRVRFSRDLDHDCEANGIEICVENSSDKKSNCKVTEL